MLSKKILFTAFAFLLLSFGSSMISQAQAQSVTINKLPTDTSKWSVTVSTNRGFSKGSYTVTVTPLAPNQPQGGTYSNTCPAGGGTTLNNLVGSYTISLSAAASCGLPMTPQTLTTSDNKTYTGGDGNPGETILITAGVGQNSGW